MADGLQRTRATATKGVSTTSSSYDAYGRRVASKAKPFGTKPFQQFSDGFNAPQGGPGTQSFAASPAVISALKSMLTPQTPATPVVAAPVVAAPAPVVAAPAAAALPLDSTFAAGVARLLAGNTNQLADYNQQNVYDTTDHSIALQALARARAQDLVGATHTANAQGLFHSGQLGQQKALVNRARNEQQDASNTAFDRAMAARQAAIARLGTVIADPTSPLGYTGTGEAGLSLADLAAAATERQIVRDQNRPVDPNATGLGAMTVSGGGAINGPTVPDPGPVLVSSKAQKPTVKKKKKGK